MRRLAGFAILALFSGALAWAQDPAIAPVRPLPATPPNAAQQQDNASSATKDNSGTTGDQITKPPGARESTLIGCLSGPDKSGKYTLRSMSHRMGVEVVGPDDLKNDAGAKVKLTGKWEPTTPSAQSTSSTEPRRFQVTGVEVMSKKCSAPSETTPESKNKKQKTTVYDAGGSDSSK